MSKEQFVNSKSKAQAEIAIAHEDVVFDKLYMDIPAIKVPKGGFTQLENIHSYPHELLGRHGTYKYSTLTPPSLATGFTASKAGTTITVTVGTVLASYGTGDKYFVWADTGENEQIISVNVGAGTMMVKTSGTHASTAACWIREAGYGSHAHKKTGLKICQFGNRIFFTDTTFAAYTQILPKTRSDQIVSSSKTTFSTIDDDYVLAVNSSGLFKICISTTDPYYTRMNTPCPEHLVHGVAETDILTYGRRYIYSMTTLTGGAYTGNRIGDPSDANNAIPTLKVEQESGTTKYNANFIDYGEVFTEKWVGTGEETYGLVIGGYGSSGTIDGICKDIELWRTLTGAGFSIDMNGLGPQDIFCDFGAVDTLDDVCRVVQNALRVYVPSATVKIDVNSLGYARFLISCGKIDGTYITAIGGDPIASPVDTGLTDISGEDYATTCGLLCDALSGGVIATATTTPNYYFTAPSVVGGIIAGKAPSVTPDEADRKWTHASIFCPLDTGKEGINPNNGLGNDPELYIYNNDIPLIKAFTASNAADGIVRCTHGYFNQEDCGNTLTFLNGETTILSYLCEGDGTRLYTGTSPYAKGSSVTVVTSQSAAFGCLTTSIITASKSDHTVTRTLGRKFNSGDVGKPIFWANGEISWIKTYTSVDVVQTIESSDIASMACALDPDMTNGRKFCDTITGGKYNDLYQIGVLSSRIDDFYIARHRLFEPLPDGCGLGTIVPGFMVVAKRGEQKYYYSQIANEMLYRAGYYYAPQQFESRVKDVIQSIEDDPDYVTIRCANSTYVTNVATPIFYSNPKTKQNISLLPPTQLLSDSIGCVHTRTIQSVGIGRKVMICSDYVAREFTPQGYSDSISRYQVESVLKGASLYNCSHYDDHRGYVVWIATEI